MSVENGQWVMHGRALNDPKCLRTPAQLLDAINRVGFLPLFAGGVKGFSVEEQTSPLFWWSGDPEHDPWEWRAILARSGQVAYGKFFGGKAGFISLPWLPVFANYRRDGYDFDARWDDELATARAKKVMDVLEQQPEVFSFALKKEAGFGKEGEKNFEGIVTALQMQTYLCIKDFRPRTRKKDGKPYGWPITVYSTPERLFGEDLVTAEYATPPAQSFEDILARVAQVCPKAKAQAIKALMK